jgi:hypothetical protein
MWRRIVSTTRALKRKQRRRVAAYATLLLVVAAAFLLLVLRHPQTTDTGRDNALRVFAARHDAGDGAGDDADDDTGVGVKDEEVPGFTRASSTLVTAHFEVSPGDDAAATDGARTQSLARFMSVRDPVVVFTSPQLAATVRRLRAHAPLRTLVVPVALKDTLMARKYPAAFWRAQLDMQPQEDGTAPATRSEAFWLRNERSNWLLKAATLNPFSSSFFAWMDADNLRDAAVNDTRVLRRIPTDYKANQIMLLHPANFPVPLPDASEPLSGALTYVHGGFIGGSAAAITRWHKLYYAGTMDAVYAPASSLSSSSSSSSSTSSSSSPAFIGNAGHLMASTCLLNPGMCFLVRPPAEGYGAARFYMAPYLAGRAPDIGLHKSPPSISVCIPATLDDVKERLPRLLASIDRQPVQPKDVIIIIANTGVHVCSHLHNQLIGLRANPSFKVFCWSARSTVGSVRNFAASFATGDIVTFMTADSYMLDFRLPSLLSIFQTHSPMVVMHSWTSNSTLVPVSQADAWKTARIYKGCELFDIEQSTADDFNHRWLIADMMHSQMTVDASVLRFVQFRVHTDFAGADDTFFIRDVIRHYGRVDYGAMFFHTPLSWFGAPLPPMTHCAIDRAPLQHLRGVVVKGSTRTTVPLIVIGMFGTWDMRRERDVLRQTWFRFPNVCSSSPMSQSSPSAQRPRPGCSVTPLFIMGVPRDRNRFAAYDWNMLQRENATHGDLRVLDMTENVHEGKPFAWFQYVAGHALLSRVPLVAKCDMNTFVYTPELETLLRTLPSKNLYYGMSLDRASCGHALSCPTGWMYMSGQLYVVSQDLVRWVVDNAANLSVYSRVDADVLVGSWFLRHGKRLNLVGEPSACKPWQHSLSSKRLMQAELVSGRARRAMNTTILPPHDLAVDSEATSYTTHAYDHNVGCRACYYDESDDGYANGSL